MTSVLAVMVVVVFGGYVVAGALSEPAGPPVTVAGIVRVSPLSGWEVAERSAEPASVRLTRGSGNLDVMVFSFSGTPIDLAAEYVEQALRPQADRLEVSQRVQVVRAGNRSGIRIAYIGLFRGVQFQIEGTVTAVVSSSGRGVVFDGWAPAGLLQYVMGDLDTMIDTAAIR
ncbi:MAG TPA: hypothetical protein VGB19_01820 [Actinomycetota bacterium]